MLKYDTMHGQFDGTIEADVENSKLIVNGQAIRITAERNPADLKWNEVEAEYVVESTGLFFGIRRDISARMQELTQRTGEQYARLEIYFHCFFLIILEHR